MAMVNIFSPEGAAQMVARIEALTPESKPLWGKMNVGQMLAHLCVSYEMVYETKHRKPGALLRLLLKLFVKEAVVSEKPYRKNLRTAPAFLMVDEKNFEAERGRLIGYIRRTQELGAGHFDGHESLSFGPLSKGEWNNLFAKHLDHHLTQFGV